MNTQQVQDRLIKLPEVLLICGLSRSAVYKQAEAGSPVPELCREHGISNATFYK